MVDVRILSWMINIHKWQMKWSYIPEDQRSRRSSTGWFDVPGDQEHGRGPKSATPGISVCRSPHSWVHKSPDALSDQITREFMLSRGGYRITLAGVIMSIHLGGNHRRTCRRSWRTAVCTHRGVSVSYACVAPTSRDSHFCCASSWKTACTEHVQLRGLITPISGPWICTVCWENHLTTRVSGEMARSLILIFVLLDISLPILKNTLFFGIFVYL